MCVATESDPCTFDVQLHKQILVKATHVKMEERVFVRPLVSFALVLMTTLEIDVNNVCRFRHNIPQCIQNNNVS